MSDIQFTDLDIPNFQEARELLRDDEKVDYYDLSLKYNPKRQGTKYQNYYAFDCEMVWLEERKAPLVDNRKSIDITLPIIQDYHVSTNKKGYRKSYKDNPDEAQSIIEVLGRDKFISDVKLRTLNRNELQREAKQKQTEFKNIRSGLCQITIVDWNGHVIYNKYIQPDTKIIWTSYKFSGIHQTFFNEFEPDGITKNPYYHVEKLKNGEYEKDSLGKYVTKDPTEFVKLSDVHKFFKDLLFHPNGIPKDNAMIIGHNIINSDIKAMELDPKIFRNQIEGQKLGEPQRYGQLPLYNIIRDTNDYYIKKASIFMGNISLEGGGAKELIKEFLNKNIQEFTHDPSEDARAALALYKLYENKIETNIKKGIFKEHICNVNKDYPYFGVIEKYIKILAFLSKNYHTNHKYKLQHEKIKQYLTILLN